MTANTHPGLKGMQLLRYFKGTQNVVFLRDPIRYSFGRETPIYSPDFHHPFSKTIVITANGGRISCQVGYNRCKKMPLLEHR